MTKVPEEVQEAYGELPSEWKLEKLKFFANVRNSNVDKTISEDEEPVRLCNYTNVYYNDRITPDMQFMDGTATEPEIKRFQLKRDQVIITKDSEGWDDIGIPALVAEDMPEVLCGYHLSVLEPGPNLDGGFLAWLCRAEPLNDQFKLAANGVTRFGLGQYAMKNAFIALPPLHTQRRIARFLDEKTARIDGLIEKKRELLDRLAEKRQALISRVVTKGLNPEAPMKPSAIDWLGDIPEHWEVLPLNRIIRMRSGDFISASDIKTGGKHLVFGGNGVRGYTKDFNTIGPIILVGRQGAHCGNVQAVHGKAWVSEHALRCFPEKMFEVRWLAYMLETMNLNQYSVSAAQPGLSVDNLKHLRTTYPPPDDQRAIAAQLDSHCCHSRKVVHKTQKSLNLLEEYRSALITAAVTGHLLEMR